NELSKLILANEFTMGDTIYVDADGERLRFSKEPFEEEAPASPAAEAEQPARPPKPTRRKR
ncbi:hypothetical protein RZS08_39030, partial [Arthrospira platensis SPKY1]|nr:hypothetical protein [Arthrospira platensis SPKY1]